MLWSVAEDAYVCLVGRQTPFCYKYGSKELERKPLEEGHAPCTYPLRASHIGDSDKLEPDVSRVIKEVRGLYDGSCLSI